MSQRTGSGDKPAEHEQDDSSSDNATNGGPASSEGQVRPSIHLKMIRHAESANNQVYRDARRLYGGGTPAFDLAGWTAYVDAHRSDDPGLSDVGSVQADRLADYLVDEVVARTSSRPVRVVTSPMRRTLETIRPTLERLREREEEDRRKREDGSEESSPPPAASCIVNAFYHESEGCHVKDEPRPGMNRRQIAD